MEQMAEHEKPKDGYKSKEGELEPEYEQNGKPSKLCGCNKKEIKSATIVKVGKTEFLGGFLYF